MTDEQHKERAIDFAIRQSVENWLKGRMEDANHFFEVALSFYNAPAAMFNPEETHV